MILPNFCNPISSNSMARKPTHNKGSDGDVRRLLKRYSCPMPFHAIRAFFLGRIAKPKIDTRPLQALEDLWDGDMPEFESLDDANELMNALINGLWNRLTRHQDRKHPFRLTRLPLPADKESIRQFAETRVEELEGFINGLFGDDEALDLPESAHDALGNLGELRSFFGAFVQFANDYEASDEIKDTVSNLQELSVIAGKEINRAVLSCSRARRAFLETMLTSAPTRH
jgi:hypothetical protein